jgi:hypothetical protein
MAHDSGITQITLRRARGGPIVYIVVGSPDVVESRLLSAMNAGKKSIVMVSGRTGKNITIDLSEAETYTVKAGSR